MYRRVDDFLADLTAQRNATLKVLRALTDDSLGQRATPEGRTLGRLAWHLVGTLGEMPASAGLATDASTAQQAVPAHAAGIAAAYERASEAVAAAVRQAWSDADLDGVIELYGRRWERGRVLRALLEHETHHRGQMTVLMRQAGVVVPGVVGPAREEWAAMGLPPRE